MNTLALTSSTFATFLAALTFTLVGTVWFGSKKRGAKYLAKTPVKSGIEESGFTASAATGHYDPTRGLNRRRD